MELSFDTNAYFTAVLSQDGEAIRAFFHPGAQIRWHATRELFTVDEFIRVNVEYPGVWRGEVEHEICIGENGGFLVVVAGHIFEEGSGASFHCVSYLRIHGGRIASLDEYWADDGEPPEWRRSMSVGRRF